VRESRLREPVILSVELYGVVRDVVKDTKVELELPDRRRATYRELLEGLAERYGPGLRGRLFDRSGPASYVKVFAGGRVITDLDQPIHTESDQAVRVIVFAAAGGG
jgi:hypothetical protein